MCFQRWVNANSDLLQWGSLVIFYWQSYFPSWWPFIVSAKHSNHFIKKCGPVSEQVYDLSPSSTSGKIWSIGQDKTNGIDLHRGQTDISTRLLKDMFYTVFIILAPWQLLISFTCRLCIIAIKILWRNDNSDMLTMRYFHVDLGHHERAGEGHRPRTRTWPRSFCCETRDSVAINRCWTVSVPLAVRLKRGASTKGEVT